MDPAHKLLAATAHRFYTSLFRKRLTQPPPPPPPPPQPPGLSLGLTFLGTPVSSFSNSHSFPLNSGFLR